MAKLNHIQPGNVQIVKDGKTDVRTWYAERELSYSTIIERLKVETKLFTNLAMCEAQLKSFNDDFVNNCLTGHAMMEWSDKIEKLEKAKAMIHKLINEKAKELMLEKKG